MRNKTILCALVSCGIGCSSLHAQNQIQWTDSVVWGINEDPTPGQIGFPPHEMDGRKEVRDPILTFDDCSKWKIRTDQTEAKLYRTKEQRIISEYSGKVVYTTKARTGGFRLELNEPIQFEKEWDCINFWNHGDHWVWIDGGYAMRHHAIIQDAKQLEIVIPFTQEGEWRKMDYKYWFLNHIKLNDSIARPIKLIGLEFWGNNTIPDKTNKIFLGPIYGYQEVLKPLKFKEFPKKLPFPVRQETILPINKEKNFRNEIKGSGNEYVFKYKAKDANIAYHVNIEKPLNAIYMHYKDQVKCLNKNAEIVFADHQPVTWEINNKRLANDTLYVDYEAKGANFARTFKCSYTINQKSLIWTINEDAEEGCVERIVLGETDHVSQGKIIEDQFLLYNPFYMEDDCSVHVDAPGILYNEDLFYFSMFDWYYTNASTFYGGKNEIKNGLAHYNGGAKYIPINNGKRNPVQERLFFNVSPDIHEVFPTIDNPKSSMRLNQGDRFWMFNQGTDLKKLQDYVANMRFMGAEKVSIRYHEEFWRNDGGSYTFKTEPNPDLGPQRIKDFVTFVKKQDWRIGTYSNYMDFAPVNKMWDEDMVRISDKDGNWGPAWCRCYAPKPSRGWEVEHELAPKIHKMFGTNFTYCDVETCISPMARVDYDSRVPGAGKFRATFEYIGMTLMNERRAYQGPVYSEGASNMFYAGLVDGNYSHIPVRETVLPDFYLMKMHPLEMDGLGISNPSDSYIAYAYIYGNIGYLSEGFDAIRKYAFLQPFQKEYVMIPMRDIRYWDGEKYYNTSEAIKYDKHKYPGIRLEYESGLVIYANFSEKMWNVEIDGKQYQLPRFGVIATLPKNNLFAVSSLNPSAASRKLLERVYSDEIYYLDSYGEKVSGDLAGQGAYMLKKEKFGWEIIPLNNLEVVDFDLSLLGLAEYGVDVEAVDKNGDVMEVINAEPFEGKVTFNHKGKYAKYRLCPVTTITHFGTTRSHDVSW